MTPDHPTQAVAFTLNGKPFTAEVDDGTSLMEVLREQAGLISPKNGCAPQGSCGCCTVLIDGMAVKSCSTPVETVANRRITTIEGLSAGHRHPIQKAWIDGEVPQCGYCQPGQMMTAAALLAMRPAPTDAEIDQAMSAVLCRCGTYQRIRSAIHRASKEVNVR